MNKTLYVVLTKYAIITLCLHTISFYYNFDDQNDELFDVTLIKTINKMVGRTFIQENS